MVELMRKQGTAAVNLFDDCSTNEAFCLSGTGLEVE
jgi:hypothetical protein